MTSASFSHRFSLIKRRKEGRKAVEDWVAREYFIRKDRRHMHGVVVGKAVGEVAVEGGCERGRGASTAASRR
jgi:hypothetical protein